VMVVTLIFMATLAPGVPSPDPLARQVQEDLELGKYSVACQKLEKAIRASPQNSSLWFLLGIARSKLTEVAPAIEAFEKVVSIDPRHAPAYFNLGLLYGYRGQPEKALEMYRRGLKIDPNDLPANQNYAFLLMRAQSYGEAIDPLLKLKAANESDLSVRSALIECYGKSRMKLEAEKEIQQFLEVPTASETDKLNLAGTLVEDGELDTAQVVLERLVASSPESAEAEGKLGLLLSMKNQFEEAYRHLRKAVQLAPDSPEYAIGLAEVLLLSKHPEGAIKFLTAVRGRFGTLPEFQYKLALAYYSFREYPRAIAELEKVARQRPDSDLVQLFLGLSHVASGHLEQAETHFRKAIELDPGKASNFVPLAQLLRKQGGDRLDEAIRYMQTLLERDPSDMQCKLELALCYEKKGRLEESQVLLEDVTRTRPELVEAHVALARVYHRLGKKQEGDREKSIVARLEDARRAAESLIPQSLPPPKR